MLSLLWLRYDPGRLHDIAKEREREEREGEREREGGEREHPYIYFRCETDNQEIV